jgi:hypothetical protein
MILDFESVSDLAEIHLAHGAILEQMAIHNQAIAWRAWVGSWVATLISILH